MSLEPYVRNGQLHLDDQTLSLTLALHDGLHLAVELDRALTLAEHPSERLIEGFYRNLLDSLLLLPPRERQGLMQEASLEAIACLLRIFRGQPLEEQLRSNLSSRRISQIEEEPLYLARNLPAADELTQVLAPFHRKVEEQVLAGRITLQDPRGIYY
jgi:hypothetical protein